MPFQQYFRGKVCIVTGAASGIGFALSRALLQAGATVVMADRDTSALMTAIERTGAPAERVQPFPCDVTREDQVRELVEETAAVQGRLDVLFNNAGVPGTMPIEQATLDVWRRQVDINLWGVLYGVHFALPIMRRQGHGHIVNTSSLAGLMPFPFQAPYVTTKFAVVGLSESLRYELADEGIHFTVVCPGNVVSGIFQVSATGERVENPIPPDALPTDEAAELILAGVARKDGILIVPPSLQEYYRLYRTDPEEAEQGMKDLRDRRRAAFLTGGPVS